MKLYSYTSNTKTILKQIKNISSIQNTKIQQDIYNLVKNNPNSHRAKFILNTTKFISFLDTATSVYGFKKPSQN